MSPYYVQPLEPEREEAREGASTVSASQAAIAAECDELKAMLLQKNEDYGDSALHPVRIFSKASAEEQILVRIDDKVNRIIQGKAGGEDVTKDLIGYFILLRVRRRLDEAQKNGAP